MTRHVLCGIILALAAMGGSTKGYALMPLAKPEPFAEFDPGSSAPFVGSWSISIPTMEVTEPSEILARCTLPVRIQAANESHIFYLGPREAEPSTAMELQEQNGGALWVDLGGGPSFFAFWVNQDVFYLYDTVPVTEADWGLPYVYVRCSDQP